MRIQDLMLGLLPVSPIRSPDSKQRKGSYDDETGKRFSREHIFAGRYFRERIFSREDIFAGRYFRVNSIFAKISSRENISNSLFAKFSSRENKVLYSIGFWQFPGGTTGPPFQSWLASLGGSPFVPRKLLSGLTCMINYKPSALLL